MSISGWQRVGERDRRSPTPFPEKVSLPTPLSSGFFFCNLDSVLLLFSFNQLYQGVIYIPKNAPILSALTTV